MHQRASDSAAQPGRGKDRVGAADAGLSPSLPSLPFPREEKREKERESARLVKRAYDLPEDVVAWLDTKTSRGEKTRTIVTALRAAMALEATEEEQKRLLLVKKKAEIQRLQAEVRLLQAHLDEFDLEANREAAWRDEIRLYLSKGPHPDARHKWAAARGIPADTFDRLAAEVQRVSS